MGKKKFITQHTTKVILYIFRNLIAPGKSSHGLRMAMNYTSLKKYTRGLIPGPSHHVMHTPFTHTAALSSSSSNIYIKKKKICVP